MPWDVKHGKGDRPWKIRRADTGEVVGSSTSKEKALASTRARYAHSNDVSKKYQPYHYGERPPNDRHTYRRSPGDPYAVNPAHRQPHWQTVNRSPVVGPTLKKTGKRVGRSFAREFMGKSESFALSDLGDISKAQMHYQGTPQENQAMIRANEQAGRPSLHVNGQRIFFKDKESRAKHMLRQQKKVNPKAYQQSLKNFGWDDEYVHKSKSSPTFSKTGSIAKGREDWKNITELEDERTRHRRTKRHGLATAGLGASAAGLIGSSYAGSNGRGSYDVARQATPSGGITTERGPYVRNGNLAHDRSAVNIGSRPAGVAQEPKGAFGVTRFGNYNGPNLPMEHGPKKMLSVGKPGGMRLRFTKPAAGLLGGAAALTGAGLGMAGYGAAQDRRKARMVAQRRKQRANSRGTG